jgi:arabinogalactan oligomer/maltooligosaccharide transport system permease protein
MIRKPSRLVLILQYTILVLGALFALYPLWFAFLASGTHR